MTSLSVIGPKSGLAVQIESLQGWPELANVEAEAALLGGLMIDNSTLSIALAVDLQEGHFFEPVHGRIYSAITHSISLDEIATPVTLRPRFEDDPAIKQLGGVSYLAQLTGSGAALIGIKSFAKQVRDLARLRQVREALLGTLSDVNDLSEYQSLPDIFAKLDQAAVEATAIPAETKSDTVLNAWDKTMNRLDEVRDGKIEPAMKVDGLPDWNKLLAGGMREGQLIVLAGRPGMGKTATVGTIAASCARAGLGTLFYTREMSTDELMERMITDVCFDYGHSFTYENLKRGKVSPSHRHKINDTRERSNSSRLSSSTICSCLKVTLARTIKMQRWE